jgi:hypothetical protein
VSVSNFFPELRRRNVYKGAIAYGGGGGHAADNYLPAHALCNNYRWDYGADEFQQILKLGVWLRTQIERKTPLGLLAAKSFLAHETVREGRRKPQQINKRRS